MCYSIKYIIIFVICYVIIYYNHNIIVIAERRERSEQSEANNRVLFEIPRYLYIYIYLLLYMNNSVITNKHAATSAKRTNLSSHSPRCNHTAPDQASGEGQN